MILKQDITRISKLLSFALRHKPVDLNIHLDENGWTDVSILLQRLVEKGENINIDILKYVVATNEKQRFAFNSDETKIRANQGHSVSVQLEYAPQQPPKFLYHGTIKKFMPFILKDGLQKMKRHHVHLTNDIATATKVAERRGKAVILIINAGQMFLKAHNFYLSDNGVWLTTAVPPEFITRLP